MSPAAAAPVVIALALGVAVAACGGDDGPTSIDTDGAVSTLASGESGFYVGYFGGAIERRDGDSGDVEARIELDDEISGLAANSTMLYATIQSTDTVVALDAVTLDEVTRTTVDSVGGMSGAIGPIAASADGVVVGDFDNVIALDPGTLEQRGRSGDLAGSVSAVALGGDSAYAITSNGQLYRLDPDDGGVLDDRDVSFTVADECGLVADDAGVWVASRAAALFEPASLDLVDFIDLGNALAVISNGSDGVLIRGSAADQRALFSVDATGRVTGQTEMPGGQCLVRGGDASRVWGRDDSGLVGVSTG